MPFLDSTIIIEKRSTEKILVAMDFGAWLSTDETISTADSVIASGLTIGSATISGSRVLFFVEGGETGSRYQVTVTITTSTGQIFVGEGPLKVVP